MSYDFALFIPILIMSVVVHEVAHAWQARREGDPTADELGRITLNPFPHLDLIGSVLVPIVLYRTGGFIFGWAKPVPVVPSNFRTHPGGDIRVSLAGIVSNLGLAVLSTGVGAAVAASSGALGEDLTFVLLEAAYFGIFINLLLAFFNLLPIPPLDGSHVVANLLPPAARARYQGLGRFGIPLLFLIVIFAPGAFDILLAPVYWVQGWADSFIRLWL